MENSLNKYHKFDVGNFLIILLIGVILIFAIEYFVNFIDESSKLMAISGILGFFCGHITNQIDPINARKLIKMNRQKIKSESSFDESFTLSLKIAFSGFVFAMILSNTLFPNLDNFVMAVWFFLYTASFIHFYLKRIL